MNIKRRYLSIAMMSVLLLVLGLYAFPGDADGHNVDFYETPLVCNGAPEIGCGSRSKPVLLDLENESLIAEAWLNRAGTVMAIVWVDKNEQKSNNATIDTIFARHSLDVTLVSEERRTQLLENFRTENAWYRGRQVDQLSMEEAGILADRVAGMIEAYHPLEDKLRAQVVADVKTVFVKWFTNDTLAARMHGEECIEANQELQQEVMAVGSALLGDEVIAEIMRRMEESQNDEAESDR